MVTKRSNAAEPQTERLISALRCCALLASLLVLVAGVSLGETFHAIGPRGPAVIVIPSSPSQAEQLAAGELGRYLQQMTGAVFPIRFADSLNGRAPALIVGWRALQS